MSQEDLDSEAAHCSKREDISSLNERIRLIDFKELEWIKHVAKGGMAEISLYRWKRPGFQPLEVAKKSLFRGSVSGRYMPQLRSEMDILARIKHDNIVKTFGIVETDHDFGILMEYLPFGSYKNFFGILWDQIKIWDLSQKLEKVMVPLKIRILDEVVDAMRYLHDIQPKRVLHLDLKSDNVLLDELLNAKICDFGLSRMTTLTSLRNSTTVDFGRASGTPGYIAPERLQNVKAKPTTKSDVYSFGILQWEILTDKLPYEGVYNNDFALLSHHIVHQNLRPDVDGVPEVIIVQEVPELVEMMKRAWCQDPNRRPSFQELHEELNSLKSRDSQFAEQADTAAMQILARWKSMPSTTTTVSEPHRRYPGIATRDQSISTSPQRQPLSLPADPSKTVPKEVRFGPTRFASPMERDISKNRNQEDAPDFSIPSETDPLIPRYVVKKSFLSTTKILVFVAICLSVLAAGGVLIWWQTTRQSINPVCPDLGCPPHGGVSCTNVSGSISQKCTFTCEKGYQLVGPKTVTCTGGKWNNKPPICEPVCSKLKPLPFGGFTCTNQNFVNSICTFTCQDNHRIQGNRTVTCQSDSDWSHPEPSCVCPPCSVGDKCQYSTSWKTVDQALDQMLPYVTITINYGGNTLSCTNDMHSWKTWSGSCTDGKTGTYTKCRGYSSTKTAAKHAAAELIRKLVKQKIYPQPCDSQDLPTGCP